QTAKTFSISFHEEKFNEIGYAREAAARFKTDHREFEVTANAVEVLPLLVERFGEPFGDASAVPTYYVSRETSKHVKVALSGDGHGGGGDDRGTLLAPRAGSRRGGGHGRSRHVSSVRHPDQGGYRVDGERPGSALPLPGPGRRRPGAPNSDVAAQPEGHPSPR